METIWDRKNANLGDTHQRRAKIKALGLCPTQKEKKNLTRESSILSSFPNDQNVRRYNLRIKITCIC